MKNRIHSSVSVLLSSADAGSVCKKLQMGSRGLRAVAGCCPIGLEMGDDTLKLAQFEDTKKGISLIAGGSENRPADVEPGSANWQRWAIEAIKKVISNGKFRGREVVATIPGREVFIDHIKMPKIKDDPENAIFSKIKSKLPFEPDNAMIKYMPMGNDNVLVIATGREKINRYLAVCENANLQIRSIDVWPAALTNSYIKLFAKRKADIEAVVMLLEIEPNCTNVVICRHKNLLFARPIPIGSKRLEGACEGDKESSGSQADEMMTRLVSELTACKWHFGLMYKKAQIKRLIFLSGQTVDKEICGEIAKRMEMPAQIGDCLAAVEAGDCHESGIDEQGRQVSWATAFGLSLS